MNKNMAIVLYVIAREGFRDEEYFIPREVFIAAGHTVVTASNGNAGEIAEGSRGGSARVDSALADARAVAYDAVVFAGGPGALKNLDNEESYRLIRETVSAHKLLGAICVAPVILAHAGVLEGKKATAWGSPSDKNSIAVLKNSNAEYVDAPVVEDGAVITANGPKAARAFGEALAARLRF